MLEKFQSRDLLSDGNVPLCAIYHPFQLFLLCLGHLEFVHRLPKIIQKSLPPRSSNQQMLVRISHRSTGILLRSTGRRADHFYYKVPESRGCHSMMGVIHSWVGIQTRVDHDPVDDLIHDGRDIINTPQPLIKTWLK